MEQSKICTKCKEIKLVSNFRRPTVKSYWCDACCKIRAKNWYDRGDGKNWRLKYEYGITLEQYNIMLLKQEGRCGICNNLPGKLPLAVDHCHDTKKVRGLLCNECNTGIGYFKNNKLILQQAIKYLQGGSNE